MGHRRGDDLHLEDVVVAGSAAQIIGSGVFQGQLRAIGIVLGVGAAGDGSLGALRVQNYHFPVVVAALDPPDLHGGGAGGFKTDGIHVFCSLAAEVDPLGGFIAVFPFPGLGAAVYLGLGGPEDGEGVVDLLGFSVGFGASGKGLQILGFQHQAGVSRRSLLRRCPGGQGRQDQQQCQSQGQKALPQVSFRCHGLVLLHN